MATRWFKIFSAVILTCVALVGCGQTQLEPEPSPEGAKVLETPESRPERALEEQGADAALPPDQRTQEPQ